MPTRYTLIKGQFPIVGTEPDGDTVRFQPDTPGLVEALGPSGQKPSWSHGGTQISVRFEAIDALETHFSGVHQQQALGALATQRMLTLLGFTAFATSSNTTITSATPASVDGYVIANSLDSYGRMIAFVYPGSAPEADGAAIFLDVPRLAQSVNVQLLGEGVVYPAFYTSLPVDLKDNLAAESRVVRERDVGVWPEDAPSVDREAAVPDLPAAEALVMWPKLFRRLTSYFQGGGSGLAGFDAWLRADLRTRDDYLQLPTGEFGNMHDLVEITGDTMKLRYRPEDLVVLPDTFVPPGPGGGGGTGGGGTSGGDGGGTGGGTSAPTLRIIAALVNPAGDDTGHETVTLLNVGASPASLDGWQLRDRQLQASGKPGVSLSGTIAPGETLRVAVKAPVLLGNSGDDIVLIDPYGAVADTRTYTSAQGSASGITIAF